MREGRKRPFLLSLFLLSLFLLINVTCVNSEHVQWSIRRGQTPCRGVNLGGWLVIEKWMSWDSPIFQGVPDDVADAGETKVMNYLGHAVGDPRFQKHWQTWITEQDIAEIARFGLNSVRVPVGYWIVGFDNSGGAGNRDWQLYAPGGLEYLDNLIRNWAVKYNIAVLVSIHAAKGSQNGQDHSAPPDPKHSYWSQYEENVNNTIDVAEFLAQRYKDDAAFLGLGLINEPGLTTDEGVLKRYYENAYQRVRTHSDCILAHMPFLWQQFSPHYEDFTPPPNYFNVWHEWHKYLLWGFEKYDENGIRDIARNQLTNEMKNWKGNWLFTGEWSLATTAKFSDEEELKAFAREYVSALNNGHSGWTYWSWKVSGDEQGWRNTWSLRQMLRKGILTL